MNIVWGLLIAAMGTAMVIKTEWLVNNFGRIAFFDRYLGSEGGTRLGYKLIGLVAAFIGILMATGLVGGFLQWILGPLLRASRVDTAPEI
ncbi:MAG: hypothetical protein WCK11_03815 [Candidatus Falkowbacteria bacterium]